MRQSIEKYMDLHRNFFPDYRKRRIEIAVVGTVKAGKSSLINALIGTRLASVDPTPETSILVKYRTTSEGNYLKIKLLYGSTNGINYGVLQKMQRFSEMSMIGWEQRISNMSI